MHNAVVHAGDWELRVRAGPMLRSAETRSLCASWFAPRRPWCVAGPGPPADCPCGALDLCGVAAHVPEAVHGRSFVEAVHAPTGARVAIDALHALRGWAALSASRDAAGAFARCERSPFWAQEEAAAVARARRGAGGAGEADDARARPAPAWDWTFETDYGGTLGRAGDGAPDGSRVAEAVERALRERLWAPENRPPRGAPAAAPAWVEDAAATAAASREAVEAAWRADPVEYRTRVPLFEDALHDGGLSALDCSVATTRRTWFLVLRQTIVVLGRFARVRDVTFFFDGRACYRTKTERVAAAPRAIDLRRLAPSLRAASWPFAGAVAERLDVDGRAVAAPRAPPRAEPVPPAALAARAAPDDDGDAAPGAPAAAAAAGDAVVVALAVDGALKVARFPRGGGAVAAARDAGARCAATAVARGGAVVAATVDGGAELYELGGDGRLARTRTLLARAPAGLRLGAGPLVAASGARVALARGGELHLFAPPDGAAATARPRARLDGDVPDGGRVTTLCCRRGVVAATFARGAVAAWTAATGATTPSARRDGARGATAVAAASWTCVRGPGAKSVRAVAPSGALATVGGLRGVARAVAVRDRGDRCLVAVAAADEVVVWALDRRAAVVDPVARRRCLRCAAPAAVVAVALGAAFVAAVDVRGGVSCFALARLDRDDGRAAGPHDATPAFRLDRDDVVDAVCPEDDATALVAATRASVALLVRDARLAPPSA